MRVKRVGISIVTLRLIYVYELVLLSHVGYLEPYHHKSESYNHSGPFYGSIP
jgi:hypothetical protein